MNRAAFLDRDGVLNVLVYRPEEGIWDSPYRLEEFKLVAGAAEAVRLLKELGLLAIVVSNQPGVAKGKCTLEFLELLNQKIREELAREGAFLDDIYYCLHHSDGVVRPYARICECRKPKPGLLFKAAKDHNVDLASSYLVGDRPADVEAGRSAGCKTIMVEDYAVAQDSDAFIQPAFRASTLLAAARLIERQEVEDGYLLGHR